jgi:hypothetical protein
MPSSHPSSLTGSGDSNVASVVGSTGMAELDIPEPMDVSVKLYTEWQQSRVVDETWKIDIQKACDIALDDRLDLKQVREDQDPGFFIQNGVKRGVARRFVDDI